MRKKGTTAADRRQRHRPAQSGGGGQRLSAPLFRLGQITTTPKAAGKAAGRTQALCIVKGMESVGPMVLTFKGMSGVAFEGNRQSLGAHWQSSRKTVITAANKASESAVKAKGVPPARVAIPGVLVAGRALTGMAKADRCSPRSAGQGNVARRAARCPGAAAKWTDVDLVRSTSVELLATVNDL